MSKNKINATIAKNNFISTDVLTEIIKNKGITISEFPYEENVTSVKNAKSI